MDNVEEATCPVLLATLTAAVFTFSAALEARSAVVKADFFVTSERFPTLFNIFCEDVNGLFDKISPAF